MADLSSLKDLASTETAAPAHVRKVDAQGRSYATGKRKNAVARVWVKPGSGKITVNGKEFAAYFARPVLQMILRQPIVAVARDGQFDIVSETAPVVGDEWSDYLEGSKDLISDWRKPLSCGNFNVATGKCGGNS